MQRIRLTDFFSTFVRNLNFNNFNWVPIAIGSRAGQAMNTSTTASPIVTGNIIEIIPKYSQ